MESPLKISEKLHKHIYEKPTEQNLNLDKSFVKEKPLTLMVISFSKSYLVKITLKKYSSLVRKYDFHYTR